jgi:hypothetical protein
MKMHNYMSPSPLTLEEKIKNVIGLIVSTLY